MNQKISFAIIILLFLYLSSVKSRAKYTENELQALSKFRHMVGILLYKDYMKEDAYLIRWLRAKDMDLQEASKMLREAINWRQQNRIDKILEEVIFIFPSTPYYTDGIDSSGSPVGSFIPGRLDVRKYILAGKMYEVVRFWDQFLEYSEFGLRSLANNNTNIEVSNGTIIFDLSGYNLRQHACLGCFTTYFDWIRHYENYYPGLCKNLFFINTPRIFMPLLDLIKPLMSKATKKVLKVFGPNKQDWVPVLLKFIPPDQLRQQFGGTKPEL